MKVLLTGGGYVGSRYISMYSSRDEIRCLDNGYKPLEHLISWRQGFDFIKGDITDFETCVRAIEGVDVVIHTAAIVGFPECREKPELAKLVNVQGTENLIKAREKVYGNNNPIRFVYCSTGSVYGKLEEICTEESPCNPQSLYGITKLEAEEIVKSVSNTVSLRFATGCGMSPKMRFNTLINELCYDAYYNKKLVIAEPDAKRTFIDVADMCSVINKCTTTQIKNLKKVYNVGSENLNLTKRQVADFIQEKTTCEIEYKDFIKDADARDYKVSTKLLEDDFDDIVTTNLEMIVNEILDCMPLFEGRKSFLQ